MLYRSDLIRAEIAARRLTLRQLGKMCGLTATTLSFVINDFEGVKVKTLAAIANALNIKMSDLFTPIPKSKVLTIKQQPVLFEEKRAA